MRNSRPRNLRNKKTLSADPPLEDDLLKEMILLSLAHDFMSPFKALANALEDATKMVNENPERWGGGDLGSIALFCREIDRDIMPAIADLYDEVERRRADTFSEVIEFLKAKAGPRIDKVVSRGREIYKHFVAEKGRGTDWSRLLRDLDFTLRKIRNMIAMLESLVPGMTSRRLHSMASIGNALEAAAGVVRRSIAEFELTMSGAATVAADAGMLWGLAQNLIGNAVKFKKPKSHAILDIRVRGISQTELKSIAAEVKKKSEKEGAPNSERYERFFHNASRLPNWIELCFRDFGIGIPAHRIWGVFKPYKQLTASDYNDTTLGSRGVFQDDADTHYGFGLALCQYYARIHEGEIAVDSKEGGPTTFGVWLPLGVGGQVRESADRFGDNWWNRATKGRISYSNTLN